ncbi:BNR/Asp-box repeat protein [Idiomarina sp. A28L]|uniref:WD40/YVTN/BNR-like repeat-containing protein n=1 Tax=Idiomarina sp. A28L TaxID=1036674 RepID=UPI0002138926|nr:YCF48-related protein [Idiomarina sp. A28L]EGN74951.1 BNR/Asp-box repeat protein [Idiomarina sp. A28L]
MKRIALAGMVSALLTGAVLSQPVVAETYDPLFTPSPIAPRATQGLLVGAEKFGQNFVVVGDYGTILTGSGNTDWQQSSVPTSVLLTSVSVVDEQHMWAAGHQGALLQSTDGGKEWVLIMDGHQLLELEFAWLQEKEEELIAAIENAEDEYEAEELEFALDELSFQMGGAEIQYEVGPTKPFLDVHFFNREVGLAVGAYGTIIRTTDGGQTWNVVNDVIDNVIGYHINKLVEGPEQSLILIGEAGLLARSDDMGESFEMIDSPYHGSLFGALFDDSGRLWLYGLRGNVFVSEDGYSFDAIDVDTRYNLNGGLALSDGRIVLVGHAGVMIVIEPDTMQVSLFSHPSGSPISDIQQGIGSEVILLGRAGLQTFALPAASQ